MVVVHRRIQDFVRGGQCPLGPPESAPDYLGEQFFVGGGGKAPLPPPPGSAPVVVLVVVVKHTERTGLRPTDQITL